jgi:hypothetical protein
MHLLLNNPFIKRPNWKMYEYSIVVICSRRIFTFGNNDRFIHQNPNPLANIIEQ